MGAQAPAGNDRAVLRRARPAHTRVRQVRRRVRCSVRLESIDLVPDFIPVLGYLDDLILVPAGIWLALKLTPDPVLMDARERAGQHAAKPVSMKAAAVIVAIWVALSALAAWWVYRTFAA